MTPVFALLLLAAAPPSADAIVARASASVAAAEEGGRASYRVVESSRAHWMKDWSADRTLVMFRRGARERLKLERMVKNGDALSDADRAEAESKLNAREDDAHEGLLAEPLHPNDLPHYRFEYLREDRLDGRACWVVKATATDKSSARLLEGEIWVAQDDGGPLLEVLSPAKPVSHMDEGKLVRRFGRLGAAAVPVEERITGSGRFMLVKGTLEVTRRISDWKPGDGGPDALWTAPGAKEAHE